MVTKKEPALRKRQQIAKANRMMFLWVAGASALVGIAVVASLFLGQKLFFNEKVLAQKDKTVSQLRTNNKVASDLQDNIRLLQTNEALNSIKNKPDDKSIQVVLDALPADANSLALGSSLQNKIFANIPSLSIESLQVDPVAGVESQSVDSTAPVDGAVATNAISFRFAVVGEADVLRQVLINMQRSIRVFELNQIVIESQGGNLQMTVQGKAFYEPARSVELKEITVQP